MKAGASDGEKAPPPSFLMYGAYLDLGLVMMPRTSLERMLSIKRQLCHAPKEYEVNEEVVPSDDVILERCD